MEKEIVEKSKPYNSLAFVGMLCLVLGLAPFFPEPHVLGKIRWVAGGAVGLGPLVWGDLLWHGALWLLLALLGVL